MTSETQKTTEGCKSEFSDLLSRVEIILPRITEDMWDMFSETSLMTWDRKNNRLTGRRMPSILLPTWKYGKGQRDNSDLYRHQTLSKQEWL